MNNIVLCNYFFYDSEGNSVSYNDTLTISTLLPGTKNVWIYRQLGYNQIVSNKQDSTYIRMGYTETLATVRRDTILVNKLVQGSNFSVPMSYFNAEDTLLLCYRGISSVDTIRVSHSSYSYVELPECGSYRFHHLSKVDCTHAGIDHIEILEPKVNYEGKENVKIYFNGVAQ